MKFFVLVGWDFWYCGHYWPMVPAQVIGDSNYGEIGGIKMGRRNRSTQYDLETKRQSMQ
jgi:hypothetical protein